jgi:hypothetical protein
MCNFVSFLIKCAHNLVGKSESNRPFGLFVVYLTTLFSNLDYVPLDESVKLIKYFKGGEWEQPWPNFKALT